MKLQYIYLIIFLGTGLLSSCFGKNTKSSVRGDERITVDVGVNTTESGENNTDSKDDKITVDVGVDTVDSNKADDGSIQVDITIATIPLKDAEPVTDEDKKSDPIEDAKDLVEDESGIYVFVDRQRDDIRLSFSAKESTETIELCLGEKEDCLANKSGLNRFVYGNKQYKNQRAMFENCKAPTTDSVWTIYAKDKDKKTLFYRAVKILGN